MNPKTVLLTGGRAPATLAVARLLAEAGHRVVVAESLPFHLCQASRFVARSVPVPAPRRDPEGFVAALEGLARRERADLLVPTCEEVFWVGRGHARLSRTLEVFCPPLDALSVLHSKWAFIERVRAIGLPAPETWLLTQPACVAGVTAAVDHALVFKPVFSRFASKVAFWRPGEPLPAIAPGPDCPWVAQRMLTGRAISTYGVCREGRLLAHAAYAANFTAGQGACIDFVHLDHPALEDWVARVVAAERLTGQVAFDMIEADGTLYPLECNPRATMGATLFSPADRLDRAFFGTADHVIAPSADDPAMLGLAMAVYGLGQVRSPERLGDWWRVMTRARDVVFRPDDPLPFLQQLAVMGDFFVKSRLSGLTMLEASTQDIEWNGAP